jgi:hypothetical protein
MPTHKPSSDIHVYIYILFFFNINKIQAMTELLNSVIAHVTGASSEQAAESESESSESVFAAENPIGIGEPTLDGAYWNNISSARKRTPFVAYTFPEDNLKAPKKSRGRKCVLASPKKKAGVKRPKKDVAVPASAHEESASPKKQAPVHEESVAAEPAESVSPKKQAPVIEGKTVAKKKKPQKQPAVKADTEILRGIAAALNGTESIPSVVVNIKQALANLVAEKIEKKNSDAAAAAASKKRKK